MGVMLIVETPGMGVDACGIDGGGFAAGMAEKTLCSELPTVSCGGIVVRFVKLSATFLPPTV